MKVLPARYASDAERLQRFEQEARATAALSHPNIVAVFDVGHAAGQPYVVSELLQGQTLRSRLQSGPLPVRKAVEYALQIARGLAAAHLQGILHRDLKPENIFVTRDGQIKILDFGLAKLIQPESPIGGFSATADVISGRGELLGTFGYMSPEQVRGEKVDARTDLFSFGAVLYEMLSGQRAFKGNTSADTITAVLKEEPPDLSATTPDVTPMLERVVHHCLEKDPAARFQSARDIAFDLESLSNVSTSASAVRIAKRERLWLRPGLIVMAVILILCAGWLFGRWMSSRSVPPDYHQLTFARAPIDHARFEPDQHTVIYSSVRSGISDEIFSITPESLAPSSTGLKDTDLAAVSPDGEMLVIQQRRQIGAYVTVGVLGRAPLTGAAPRPIATDVLYADWGTGGDIAVARSVGGRSYLEYPIGHRLYETSGYVSDLRVSPKGDLVAFADHPEFGDNAGSIAVMDRSGHKRSLSQPKAAILGLAWVPSGKEIWFSASDVASSGYLNAVDLSGKTRAVARVPGILSIQDIAKDGRVLLVHSMNRLTAMALGPGQTQERDLTIADWSLDFDISPDGRKVLLEEEGTGSHPGYDAYIRDTDGSAPIRISEGHAYNFSPDMKWVLAAHDQLYMIPIGPGEPQQITHDKISHQEAHFLPDGKAVLFTGIEPGLKPRIYFQKLGESVPRPISPEGVRGSVPTADGKSVFGFSDTVALYPIDGLGSTRSLTGILPDDQIAAVRPDGRSVLVVSADTHTAIQLFQVDLDSNRRVFVKKFGPSDPTGLYMYPSGRFTPDGKYYVYSYVRSLSELYLVNGLR